MIVPDPTTSAAPGWHDLSPGEQLEELARGEASPYWGEFRDDPATDMAFCPDHGGQVLTVASGPACDMCGRDLVTPHQRIDNWRDLR